MKYILYCRKSQESEDRQVQSLDAQERELREKASLLGVDISAVYLESQSAKTVGRPVFNEVVKQIQAGKADGILCWKLDRLARNFIDGGLIIDLLQRGVLKSIQTYEKEYLPSDNVLMMAVELGMANQYSRDLSENVKRGNREKIHQGGWPCYAPFGYLNNKADKTLFVDPIHHVYLKMMFELYSTGLYSLRCEFLFETEHSKIENNETFRVLRAKKYRAFFNERHKHQRNRTSAQSQCKYHQ